MSDNSEIADLRRELAELKRKVEPEPIDWERRIAEHRDAMHQIAEGRMARASNFSREDLAAMEAACPTSAVRDIVPKGTIKPPSADGTAGTISAVHRSPGVYPNTSGWRSETPFGPQPGIAHVDRLVDAQDVRDRAELIAQEARTAAVRKALLEAK
jgi:hypothetical protein